MEVTEAAPLTGDRESARVYRRPVDLRLRGLVGAFRALWCASTWSSDKMLPHEFEDAVVFEQGELAKARRRRSLCCSSIGFTLRKTLRYLGDFSVRTSVSTHLCGIPDTP